jgi:hypothetical protein
MAVGTSDEKGRPACDARQHMRSEWRRGHRISFIGLDFSELAFVLDYFSDMIHP